MTLIQFVQNVIGTVPSDYSFVTYGTAGLLLLLFAGLFLRFFLGAISQIFYH